MIGEGVQTNMACEGAVRWGMSRLSKSRGRTLPNPNLGLWPQSGISGPAHQSVLSTSPAPAAQHLLAAVPICTT